MLIVAKALLRALTVTLLLLVVAHAQSRLDTVHEAIENFEWEKATALAEKMPDDGTRALLLAEIALATGRLDRSYTLIGGLEIEKLPEDLRVKYSFIRAHHILFASGYRTYSDRIAAVVRAVREGLRQTGTAHDRAAFLRFRIMQTPGSQKEVRQEILDELIATPGVSDHQLLAAQADAAAYAGRAREAAVMRRSLSENARLHGHFRAHISYAVAALRGEETDERRQRLVQLWQLSSEAKDPRSLFEVLIAFSQQQDRREMAGRAQEVVGQIPASDSLLQLIEVLCQNLDQDPLALRLMIEKGEKLARKLGDVRAVAHFRMRKTLLMAKDEQKLEREKLKEEYSALDLRGIERSWTWGVKSLLIPAPQVGSRDEASMRVALDSETRAQERNDIYKSYAYFGLMDADARLFELAVMETLDEITALTEISDLSGLTLSLLSQISNDMTFPPPRPRPDREEILRLAMTRALGRKLAAKEDLVERILEVHLWRIGKNRDNAYDYYFLAGWLNFLGRSAEALELLEQAHAEEPDNVQVASALGGAKLLAGDSSGWAVRSVAAVKGWERFLPWKPQYSVQMSWEARAAGQWAEAERWARKALAEPGQDWPQLFSVGAYDVLALALAEQDKTEEGLAILDQALAKAAELEVETRSLAPALRTRADLLFRAGRQTEAAAVLAQLQPEPLPKMSVYELNLRRRVAKAGGDQAALDALQSQVDEFLLRESSLPKDPVFAYYLKAALSEKGLETAPPYPVAAEEMTFADLLEDLERLRRREPENSSLRRLSAADLKTLMQSAKPDVVFVQPVILEHSVAVIFLTRDSAGLVETFCDRSRLDRAVLGLTETLSSPDSPPEESDRAYLSRHLIEPWRGRFPKATRLRWIGEGVLQRLPLSALPDGARGSPLLTSIQITYLDGPGTTDAVLEKGTAVLLVGGASDLPGSAREMQAIRRLFPTGGQWKLGEKLEELQRLLPGHGILHVSTHGSAPSRRVMEGTLRGDGNQLSAFQIAELSFSPNSLVVLGVCESRVDANTGRDNTSLVSAARTAGASMVVGTLWPVDDEVTAKLFELFYQQLKGGRTPEEALANAQRAIAKNRPDPFYWAGLQLVTGP